MPSNPGWEWVVDEPGHRAGRGARPRLGRRARRGAGRHQPLLGDGRGHLADVRRRAAGGRARSARTSTRRSSAAADIHARERRGRRRGRRARPKPSRGRGASSPICRRRSTSCRARIEPTDDPGAARPMADRGHAARPAQGLQGAPHHRTRSSTRTRSSRSAAGSAARWSPGSPASTAGRSPCWPATPTSTAAAGPPTRRRRSTRFVDLADTFHLPVVHLVDKPGFVIGVEAEQAGTIRHGARALAAIYQAQGAVVLGDPAQGVRRRRRRPHAAPRGCTTATPGRRATGARCRSRAASRPRTAPSSTRRRTATSCAPRSRSGSTASARRSAPPRRS